MSLLFLTLTATTLLRGPPMRVRDVRMAVGLGPDEPQPSAAPLYSMMNRLIRKADRTPSVRALTSRWLTMAPEELVENALILGRSFVGDFEQGAELLDIAEEQTGVALSPRAYGALMRLGAAEARHAEVLALLGRMRASGGEPGPTMLLSAMHAAAEIGDWGGVSRLFAEYAGTDDAVEALELIGDPEVVREMEAELGLTQAAAAQPSKLTVADAEALRLALHAHCARGNKAMVALSLKRARELNLALDGQSYMHLFNLARGRKSAEPLSGLRPADLVRSLSDWADPLLFTAQARVSRLTRADRELFTYALCGVGCVALLCALLSGDAPAEGPAAFSNTLTGFDMLDAL